MKTQNRWSLVLAAGLIFPFAARAQFVSYALVNSVYSQNFNGLPTTGSTTVASVAPIAIQGQLGSTGLNGWYMLNDRGSSGSTEFRAQDGSLGSSAGRGVISFGTTGSTDRALGALATSNQISSFGVYLKNDSAITLSQFALSYVGEQWRAGEPGLNNHLAFGYKVVGSLASATIDGDDPTLTSVSALTFNTPFTAGDQVAKDGNNSLFQQSLSSIQNLSWGPGQYLILRWAGEDLSGQDNGLAIDNLNFSAIPEPGTYGAILALMTAGAIAWRNRGRRASPALV